MKSNTSTSVDFLGLSSAQWELVGTITTALSFLVAAGVAVVAVFQLRHSRRIHRDQTRPYMVLTIESGETSRSFADIVVNNIGSTPAYDLTIAFEPPLTRALDDGAYPIAQARIFAEQIDMWAPGHEFRMLFDSHIERGSERDRRAADPEAAPLVDRFEATLSYSNGPAPEHRWSRRPERWTEKQIIDARLGAGSMYTEVYGIHHAAKALREIEKVLKRAGNLDGEVHAVVEDRQGWRERIDAERAERVRRHEEAVARYANPPVANDSPDEQA